MAEERLNILTVSSSDANGGAARAAYRIFKAVQALGIKDRMLVKNRCTTDETVVELSTFKPRLPFYSLYDWIRTKVKNQLQHRSWNRYPKRKQQFMSDLRSEPLHGALQKIDYDVLHLHWCNLRFLPFSELKKVGKPIVWTLHDEWAFTGVCHSFVDCEKYTKECGACPLLASNNANDLSRAVFRKKREYYEGLDLHIVTPSRWLAECVRKSALLGRCPVTVIPNCIDTDTFAPGDRDEACRRFGLSTDRRYLLYGAMSAMTDPIKGFGELVSALKLMDAEAGLSDVELVVFGADHPLERLDLKRNVHYLGRLSKELDIVAAYRVASAMVVPSLSENLSNVIMESLSCGLPVAAFDIGGNSDMLQHKENGYLARERDSKDLAEGIKYILESEDRGRLSENARKWVIEHYKSETVAKAYLELYRSIRQDAIS